MRDLADAPPGGFFAGLTPQAPDPLLPLIKLFRDDPRPGKIDLGVGVYRNEAGETPVFAAVKAAEAILLRTQPTKSYLGPEGDVAFLEAVQPIVFGAGREGVAPVAIQTPGGTGALRIAATLAHASRPGARVWLGSPSWPIHAQIFHAAGLEVESYRYFDPERQALLFDEMMQALGQAQPGDLVLLHGCCHNPAGADPSPEQWKAIAELVSARGLVPLVDLAYQGLGSGLEEDAQGLRTVVAAADSALVAYSLDKNFGLYRERTGALFVQAGSYAELVQSNMLQLARAAWSMPPDHGAAVARVILHDPALTAQWRAELDGMRARIVGVREGVAEADPRLAALREHHGMFSLLPVTPEQVQVLRRDHGVYMAGSGRINIAGLAAANIARFVQALQTVWQ